MISCVDSFAEGDVAWFGCGLLAAGMAVWLAVMLCCRGYSRESASSCRAPFSAGGVILCATAALRAVARKAAGGCGCGTWFHSAKAPDRNHASAGCAVGCWSVGSGCILGHAGQSSCEVWCFRYGCSLTDVFVPRSRGCFRTCCRRASAVENLRQVGHLPDAENLVLGVASSPNIASTRPRVI